MGLSSLPTTLFLGLRSALFVLPWTIHLFLADLLLSLLLPLSLLAPTFVYHLSSHIAESVWRGVQLIFTRFNHAQIILSNASSLPYGESAIVVSNHIDWCDFYLIQELALKCGMLGRCRWFAKQQLKWVPFLGWGLWAMGMPLVSRRWMDDRREMERVFHGITERGWPTWLISFSESTRYTREKHAQTTTWCREHSKPLPQHTLHPRTKGFVATVQALRAAPHVRAVYDVTIAYNHHRGQRRSSGDKGFMRPPTFLQTIFRPRIAEKWEVYVHVDRFELSELPESEEGLAAWLEGRWVVKGERLEELRRRAEKGEAWSGDEMESARGGERINRNGSGNGNGNGKVVGKKE
ncbi:unnamed protein product [Zymoseptoria tritici ST99CH_1E4]|uniref:Phospholipid/glycerol acyltransferase domain-containing protein n=1 Tax=Zymoseptoria tritici ST99CH_1E4 TaxID=1276532 RepID=A0A2H1FN82_ZYMTR|nr:unnamed protein product [Zymoseptoria tritici ST99CH_1E4]